MQAEALLHRDEAKQVVAVNDKLGMNLGGGTSGRMGGEGKVDGPGIPIGMRHLVFFFARLNLVAGCSILRLEFFYFIWCLLACFLGLDFENLGLL